MLERPKSVRRRQTQIPLPRIRSDRLDRLVLIRIRPRVLLQARERGDGDSGDFFFLSKWKERYLQRKHYWLNLYLVSVLFCFASWYISNIFNELLKNSNNIVFFEFHEAASDLGSNVSLKYLLFRTHKVNQHLDDDGQ